MTLDRTLLPLTAWHGWLARPGHKIFVADRGAVRFDFPQNWVVSPGAHSIAFHDRTPPDDDCRLELSFVRLPPVDWSGLPVAGLVEAAVGGDERTRDSWAPPHDVSRGDMEMAWRERRFLDLATGQPARSRICVARQPPIQSLLTFDFWESDLSTCERAWQTVIETLELGVYIADPQQGPGSA
jgi:hypothetical protein